MLVPMDSWNAPTGGSAPSSGQGIPASNGLTRTVVAGMALHFPHLGDKKFGFKDAHAPLPGRACAQWREESKCEMMHISGTRVHVANVLQPKASPKIRIAKSLYKTNARCTFPWISMNSWNAPTGGRGSPPSAPPHLVQGFLPQMA